jgi:hypothetical protein
MQQNFFPYEIQRIREDSRGKRKLMNPLLHKIVLRVVVVDEIFFFFHLGISDSRTNIYQCAAVPVFFATKRW